MRRIDNKTLLGDETYFTALAGIVSLPRNGTSTNYEEMRLCGPLVDKLSQGGDFALLEEAEWEELCARVRSPTAPFIRNNTDILGMCEAVLRAQKVAVVPAGGE